MKTRHPLKEIAFQAGLSLATVDRVIHRRSGVRRVTVERVDAAIRELDRQSEQAVLDGRRFTIDVVMVAPDRFCTEVRAAFEAEMPGMRPASFRCRFHLSETGTATEINAILNRIRKRGSHGVILKAPDEPVVARVVERLVEGRIPVVTFVTDISGTNRLAYVGMDNFEAGRTAAYFVNGFTPTGRGTVLITLSSTGFHGEVTREQGFRQGVEELAPGRFQLLTVSEGFGRNRETGRIVERVIADCDDICAVYSASGGNRSILEAFHRNRKDPGVFVAHDLDSDNRELLSGGAISLVIHHSLRDDARSACQLLLKHHRLLPSGFDVLPSAISLATPFNLPSP